MKILFTFILFIFPAIIDDVSGMPPRENSKPTCSIPNKETLERSLSNAFPGTNVTIFRHHFSCLAVRAYNMFAFLAVIVDYSKTTSDSDVETVQIVMECNEYLEWEADTNQMVQREDSILPPTQYQCYKCVSARPDKGPGSDNGYNTSTWCLECSENCKRMGGGFCVSPSTYSCCPYFEKNAGICMDTCINGNINSTYHCTDECEGHWTGTDCKNCTLNCQNDGVPNMINCTECICPAGYEGVYCEQVITPTVSPCNTSYCLNGGEIDDSNCTKCVCPSGYYGDHCEYVSPCVSDPCLNGGTCIEDGEEYVCICPDEWTGDNCEEEIDRCSETDYCKNGGECIQVDYDNLICNCTLTNFTGPTCEEEVDECQEDPDICQNGGTCVATEESSIVCECVDGYTGPRCEEIVEPECPCLNGGSCEDLEGENICFCPEKFVGPLCEYPNPCIPNPCQNEGRCRVDRSSFDQFTCTCTDSWTGTVCDICVEVGDFNEECSIQPTKELSVENNNNRIGLIVGIIFAAVMLVLLIGSLILLAVIIYKRFGSVNNEPKFTDIDNGAFDGSKVMVNPVFIRPDDLSIEESLKTKVVQ